MNLEKYLVKDPDQLKELFSDVIDAEVTPSSESFLCSPSFVRVSALLSVFWGGYAHFSGKWMSKGVYVNIALNIDSFYYDGKKVGNRNGLRDIAISMPGEEHDYSFKNKYAAIVLFMDTVLLKPIFERLTDQSFESSLKN